MSQADQSRLNVETVGGQAHPNRPFHFPTPSQDERIRKVFGLSDEAPIPPVSDESLGLYFDFLSRRLALPFEALYCQTDGEMRQLIHYVRVTELIDPALNRKSNLHGLHCKAENTKSIVEIPLVELGVREDNANSQLIDDYAYWFVNWR